MNHERGPRSEAPCAKAQDSTKTRSRAFSAARIDEASADATNPPHLFYAVRSLDENSVADRLIDADADGRIVLHRFSSASNERLTADALATVFGHDGLYDAYVGLCGPTSLVNAMDVASRALGATSIHREDFDIRQGFGPDLSLEIDDLVGAARGR